MMGHQYQHCTQAGAEQLPTYLSLFAPRLARLRRWWWRLLAKAIRFRKLFTRSAGNTEWTVRAPPPDSISLSTILRLRIITDKYAPGIELGMKSLSATTRELINRLCTPVKGWKRLISSHAASVELLRQIGERGEPLAISSIAPFIID